MSHITSLKINVKLSNEMPTDAEDEGVEGTYEVAFDPRAFGLPLEKLASIALDVFHDKICIGTLDDFGISVTDNSGNAIADDEAHEPYSGSGLGCVYKISDECSVAA